MSERYEDMKVDNSKQYHFRFKYRSNENDNQLQLSSDKLMINYIFYILIIYILIKLYNFIKIR
jgi:hypothetical protein